MFKYNIENSYFKNILYKNQIDSTNNWAKQFFYSSKKCIDTIFIAESQTAGKGRLSRNWICDDDKQINMSILLYWHTSMSHIQLICILAALSVHNAIKYITNLSCEIKWPNDILINGKKVCGILCENILKENKIYATIVGIGINVNNEFINESISKKATSIFLESKKFTHKDCLINSILKNFYFYYKKFKSSQFNYLVNEYKKFCTSINKTIQFEHNGKLIDALAVDVNSSGELIVKSDYDELLTLNHGEIFYHNIYRNEF